MRGLYAKFSKCEFWLTRVAFLGHLILGERISMDPIKIETVISGPISTTIVEIKSRLSWTDYYGRFVEGFLASVLPLTQLLKKEEKFGVDRQVRV